MSYITNESFDQCDECLDSEGPFASVNMSYESGATLCLKCAELIVFELQDAIENNTHPRKKAEWEEDEVLTYKIHYVILYM